MFIEVGGAGGVGGRFVRRFAMRSAWAFMRARWRASASCRWRNAFRLFLLTITATAPPAIIAGKRAGAMVVTKNTAVFICSKMRK